jgi:hypothetical protein
MEKGGVVCSVTYPPHKWLAIFSHTTVNAHIYFNSFQESINHMDDQELPFGYFQEDGATYHTPEWPLEEIKGFFGNRITLITCTNLQT